MNAYVLRCRLAESWRKGSATRPGRRRSVAIKDLIDSPLAENIEPTSSRFRLIVGLAVAACFVFAVCAATIWREHEVVLAEQIITENAKSAPQVVAPLEPMDENVAATPETENAEHVAGAEILTETDEALPDLAVNELPAATAAAGQEVPAVSADEVKAGIANVRARVESEVSLVPTVRIHLQEARTLEVDMTKVPPVAKATIPAESALSLLRKGQRLLQNGDIEAARDLFRNLAEAGNIDGAIALGGTYDPKCLAASGMTNVTPDPDQALLWYRRAHLLAKSAAKN